MHLFVIRRLPIATRHWLTTVLVWSAAFATPLYGSNGGTRCCGCCQAISSQGHGSLSRCCPACSATEDSSDQAASDGWNPRKSCECRRVPAPLSEGPKRTADVSSSIDELSLLVVPARTLSVVDRSVPFFKNHGRPKRGLTALARCILLQRLTT